MLKLSECFQTLQNGGQNLDAGFKTFRQEIVPLAMPLLRKTKSEKKDPELPACLIPLEDLKVVKELGEGQYGVVQLGEWKSTQGTLMYVAIKSIKNSAIDGVLKSVLQEAQTMQKLSHENIVKFYGISLPSGEEQLRLVTEFAPYGSLEENFKKKNKNVLRVSTLYKFACQVAHGMNYLARQQLVHRDLATRNILLFEQDLVKISDFGLARSLEGDGAKEITAHTKLAVAWMPPEAMEKSVFSPAGDVWSYGITLWEMFSFGQQPWARFSLQQVKQMVATDPSKRLDKPRACPDGFYELIMLKSWASDPKDRPPFEYIVSTLMPQLQPKEGTMKISHKATERGHLSYSSREKITVISRLGDGMLLVQSENCAIGVVSEKHVEFPKKTGSSHPMQISSPFEVKKRDSREVLAELKIMAGGEAEFGEEMKHLVKKRPEESHVNNLLDLDEDDVALDPNYTLYPDPYPDMRAWSNTGATASAAVGQDPNEYIPMWKGEENDEDYMSMEHVYSSLKVTEGQEDLMKRPCSPCTASQRPGRTMSESGILPYDSDYAVPLQNTKGSKDDSSVQLDSKGIPGIKKIPPVIPARLDLTDENRILPATTNKSDRAAGLSPYATTPRKRPVPTPRKGTMERPRPVSGGTLDPRTNSDKAESKRRCNSESKPVPDISSVTCVDGQKKAPPKLPLPYESTRVGNTSGFGKGSEDVVKSGTEHSEKHSGEENSSDKMVKCANGLEQRSQADLTMEQQKDLQSTQIDTASAIPPGHNSGGNTQAVASRVSHGQEISSGPQTPAPLVDLSSANGLSQQTEIPPRYENSPVVKDLIDLSFDQDNSSKPPPLPPKQHTPYAERPVYDKPLSLAMYPDIPEEVLNQPPPRPEELFGGTLQRSNETSDLAYSTVPLFDLRGGLSTSHQHGQLTFQVSNANHSVSSTAAANPAVGHVYQDVKTVIPDFNLVNPAVNPSNRAVDHLNPPINSGDPVMQPSNLAVKLDNLAINPVISASKPAHPPANPVYPADRAANPGIAGNPGSYGEEIDTGIREIQAVCGKDVSRDWCYAALLQYQGDVEQVVHIVKAQKLAGITGKTEVFCTRTLTHCNWDLNRAAVYILENFEDKAV